MKKEDKSKQERGGKPEKKSYVAPRLVKHGSVEKLTRFGGAGAPDGYGGMLGS